MDYCKDAGEKITEESWLMQNLRDVTTPTGKGLATVPGKLNHRELIYFILIIIIPYFVQI